MYAKNTNITGAIWMVNVGIYIYIPYMEHMGSGSLYGGFLK